MNQTSDYMGGSKGVELSCDPRYRAMVRLYRQTGDAGLLPILSDYRVEHDARPLGKGAAPAEGQRASAIIEKRRRWRSIICAEIRLRHTNHLKIYVVAGNSSPRLAGEGWHYVNASGHLIRHPNAYRRAWGKPIYVSSTRRIEVGREWLTQRGLDDLGE